MEFYIARMWRLFLVLIVNTRYVCLLIVGCIIEANMFDRYLVMVDRNLGVTVSVQRP